MQLRGYLLGLWSWSVLGHSTLASATDDPSAWVHMLASDAWKTRQEAEQKLWAAGNNAVPALESAAKSANPEAAMRASKILRYLQLGLKPDSPREIIELAQNFEKMSIEGKTSCLATLKKQRQFRIALLLFQLEKDSVARQQLRASISGLAIVAARESVIAGDVVGARRFLTEFPEDPKSLTALAWMARTEGKLDAEIARTRTSQKDEDWRYHLALLRIKGDRTAVAELAEKHNLGELAAAMELLDGDAEKWLSWKAEKAEGDTADITSAYANAALHRLREGKDSNAQASNLLIKTALKEGDYTRRWAAVHGLFSLGNEAVAQKPLKQLNPSMLFGYMADREKIDEALTALNLDVKSPDYGSWIDRHMAVILAGDSNDEMDSVPNMISFLEKRGLTAPIDKHFLPRMLELAEKDNEVFHEMLGALFSAYATTRLAPETAAKVATACAKDDDVIWGSMIRLAFSENTFFTQWWEWLGEIYPKEKRSDRFHLMLTLFRVIPDKRGELQELDKNISDALRKDEGGAAENHRKLLAILAAVTGKTSYSQWSCKEESELDTDDLMNLGKWKQAAEKWEQAIGKSPDQMNAALWASLCWKLAENQSKAKHWEKLYESLVLGDSAMMIAASAIYQHLGFTDESRQWRQMALHCGIRDGAWHVALFTNAEDQLLTGQWRRAQAAYEAYILHSLSEGDTTTMMTAFRTRKKADMAWAFAMYPDNRKQSLELLRECHQSLLADASLADQFFPALRMIGAKKEHDAWFEESWQALMSNRDRFPLDDNVRNSAAWLAARSMMRLDDAENESNQALRLRPNQAAYLDTMAEIHFAKGNRKKAVEWSQKAISADPRATPLREQYYRFLNAPFPR
jgi:tetratricopeptide (TPR) repeat protein